MSLVDRMPRIAPSVRSIFVSILVSIPDCDNALLLKPISQASGRPMIAVEIEIFLHDDTGYLGDGGFQIIDIDAVVADQG